jgi:hypothetical protein
MPKMIQCCVHGFIRLRGLTMPLAAYCLAVVDLVL